MQLPHEEDDRELRLWLEAEDRKHRDGEEKDFLARRHFPHLSASVAPRESDETPTYWED